MRPLTLARKIARLTHTRKGFDVIIMNLKKLTAVTDYFVVCSADSDVQVRAIADAVEAGVEKGGLSPWHREAGSSNWIILDYVDVVLHVFHRHTRAFYSLERLWGDAEMEKVDDTPPAPRVRRAPVKKPARRASTRKKKAS